MKTNSDMRKRKHLHSFGIPILLPYLKPFRKQLFLMMSLNLICSALETTLPLFQKYAIDKFITGKSTNGIGGFCACYFCMIVVIFVFNLLAFFFCFFMEMHVLKTLRNNAFTHLQKLSFSFFNRNSVGAIYARVMSDTERIATISSWYIMDSCWTVAYLSGAFMVMLYIHWQLALLLLSIFPVVIYFVIHFQKKLLRINHAVREFNSVITGRFNEGITGVKTIRTLSVQDDFCKKFRISTTHMRKMSVLAMRVRSVFTATVTFASSFALALVLWYGGYLSMQGVFVIGTISVFISYALSMMEPIFWITNAVTELISAQANIERYHTLISTAPEICDAPEVIEKYGDVLRPKYENREPIRGDIEFRNVSFRYPDSDVFVLEHFNLKIPHGTNVAIVGETGAGKSTIVNLVCRFFDVTSGQILIDGKDVREHGLVRLHCNIGYVLQTPYLFSGTILENLRYGNLSADSDTIERAVRRVSADTVIERMPNGYDTQVGECGDMLSTGEKQLISFARTILADPAILILDEATSSVDTLTETVIQNAIREVTANRTSFVIAHRLSTIRNADLILMLQNGKIIESGSHAELIAKHGAYYNLCARQYENAFVDTSL